MALIDGHGRVLGRWNLVDALLVLLLVVAIPAGYGAALLFRDPPPVLSEVAPAVMSQGAGQQVEIRGEHLRPYMRVSFGAAQGHGFLFYGPSQAFVPLPPLEPGTYDVVLYDYMREVGRLPQAFTVVGPPRPATVRIEVAGAFAGISHDMASALSAGQLMNAADGLIGETMTVGAPQPAVARVRVSNEGVVDAPMEGLFDLPATLALTCPTTLAADGYLRCATGSVVLAPDVHVILEGPAGRLAFRVDRIVPAAPGAETRP